MHTMRMALSLLAALTLGVGCSDRSATGPDSRDAELAFLVMAPGDNAIATVSVEVTGPGIDSTLVFNFTLVNGTATGTARVPAGAGRHIVARAFDVAAVNTHRGDTTITLVEGANPTVSLQMLPLIGGVPLTLTFGTAVVSVSGHDTTLQVGQTLQLTATAVNARGGVVPADSIQWASSNPSVAVVAATGLVTAYAAGSTRIVAAYEGAAASRNVAVGGVSELLLPILFTRGPAGGGAGAWPLYRTTLAGTPVTALLDDGFDNRAAAFSPDGSRIAFSSDRSGTYSLHLMNADGSGISPPLTTISPACCAHPDWSPDGSRIAFMAGDPPRIYTIRPDGTQLSMLTGDWNGYPRWSPDGSRIAFIASFGQVSTNIAVMDADGANVVTITSSGTDQYLSWCATNRIAFQSQRSGEWAIYTMKPDGSDVRRVTAVGAQYLQPACSPSGAWLLYHNYAAIYYARADGTGEAQVLSGPGFNVSLSWARRLL